MERGGIGRVGHGLSSEGGPHGTVGGGVVGVLVEVAGRIDIRRTELSEHRPEVAHEVGAVVRGGGTEAVRVVVGPAQPQQAVRGGLPEPRGVHVAGVRVVVQQVLQLAVRIAEEHEVLPRCADVVRLCVDRGGLSEQSLRPAARVAVRDVDDLHGVAGGERGCGHARSDEDVVVGVRGHDEHAAPGRAADRGRQGQGGREQCRHHHEQGQGQACGTSAAGARSPMSSLDGEPIHADNPSIVLRPPDPHGRRKPALVSQGRFHH